MEKISFSIIIKSDKQKVWHTMLDDETYRIWTRVFNEGSYYEGSWEQGSEIRFVGLDENGNVAGMYSRIKENIPFQFISIEHLGIIKNGVVDITSEEVKKWTPSLENYSLTEIGAETKVEVNMDIEESYKSIFEEMWPKALALMKALCEK